MALRPNVVVLWDAEPHEFLYPVVRALDTAVEGMQGDGDTLILRVSLEHVPLSQLGRLSRMAGTVNADPGGELLRFEADPICRMVSRRPILNTAWGGKLRDSGCMKWMVILLNFVALMMALGNTFEEKSVRMLDPHAAEMCRARGDCSGDVYVTTGPVHDLGRAVATAIASVTMCFLMFHLLSADLLIRLIRCFDIAVIIGCKIIAQFARVWNRLALLSYWNLLDARTVVFDVAAALFELPSFFIIVSMDAARLPRSFKFCLLLHALAINLLQYYQVRYQQTFSEQETCYWVSCSTLKSVYLSATTNGVIFLAKLAIAYLKGADLAVIKPKFRAVPREPSGWCLVGCAKKQPETGDQPERQSAIAEAEPSGADESGAPGGLHDMAAHTDDAEEFGEALEIEASV